MPSSPSSSPCLLAACLLSSACVLWGCRSESAGVPGDDPDQELIEPCIPGASVACECDGGSAGAQICQEDGQGYAACECAASCGPVSAGLTPLRRLTRSQYARTIEDLLGIDAESVAESLAPDERVGPFTSNVAAPIAELQVEQYMDGAEALAAMAVEDLDALLPCSPAAAGDDACAESFIRQLAPQAYRRPASEEEIDQLMSVYADTRAIADFEAAIRVTIQAVLQSPYLLYHVELGTPAESPDDLAAALTPYEYASRLSYFLWDTMPDAELTDAAAAGQLDDPAGRKAQVDRMLADPRAYAGIAAFHLQWLGMDELASVSKSAESFPQFDPALAAAMQRETADFAHHVLEHDDGRLETLLTAPYTVTGDERLLALYGAARPEGYAAGDPVALDEEERAGLLTHAGFLAAHAHPDQTSPVLRGVTLRQNLLCQPLPPPPPNVDNVPPEPDPDATTRERFSQHTAHEECAGCHQLIDPLGFGLEGYDPIGAFRATEGGQPVDTTGQLVATDVDGPFDGAIELAGLLASSEDVRDCVGTQWLRFALGRVETEADQCTLDTVRQRFAESDGDVRALIAEIALSDSFRHIPSP